MKRFYCTICDKVKRVQKLPYIINGADEVLAQDRIGECNWHRMGHVRPVRVERVWSKAKPVVQAPRSGKQRKSA